MVIKERRQLQKNYKPGHGDERSCSVAFEAVVLLFVPP